jgi:two-component system, chemotaxis family, CheB/CheR fusion protein
MTPDQSSQAPTPETPAETSDTKQQDNLMKDTLFPIVGIAASAGGLEAFTELLKHLPTDTGMAFVLIQHLDPNHKSLLTEILARTTQMPVSEVTDGMEVEPNHVYIIPPNTKMILSQGVLQLTPREKTYGKYLPADTFFVSLAADRGVKSIGVVLSGSDGDGSQGLIAIKDAGGVTFAQTEGSARFDSMPNTAVATGNVDFILPPQKIAEALANLSHNPFVGNHLAVEAVEDSPPSEDSMGRIFALLQSATGVDFRDYKPTTINRRIQRRMLLYKLEQLGDYAQYLQEHPAEVKALYEDILIHVTSFFRDPEAFQLLKEQVFPVIIQNKSAESPVRIWVAGCATGEEVYSIAICLLEFLEDKASHLPIQIFATDISESAIFKARLGIYQENMMVDVSPERVRRFFHPLDEGGYQINKAVREMCVFARHDLGRDPPFSSLDLISCRNVLIYLGGTLQTRIIPVFHYSLKSGGFLLLGSSESIGKHSELFTYIDIKYKVYTKNQGANRPTYSFGTGSDPFAIGHKNNKKLIKESQTDCLDLQKKTDKLILSHYAPVGVVINNKMEVLQFRGDLNPYLRFSPGIASLNLFNMVGESLLVELRTAIYQAQQTQITVRKERLHIQEGDRSRFVNLEVIPFKATPEERYFLVLFAEASPTINTLNAINIESLEAVDIEPENVLLRQEIATVKRQYAATQEYLQVLLKEHESIDQDFRIANEEILSSNEELQSTNEELQTAKEEIQSTNEELQTTNDELRSRNLELQQVNNDLINLLASINIPILMLTNDLRIRRFTPMAQQLFNFIAADVGRSLSDIRTNLNIPDLEALILEVIDTLSLKEIQVQTHDGHWYNLRIRPYRTRENKIDGVVLVLVDINNLKQSAVNVEAARQEAEMANRAKDEFLSNLSHELRNPLTVILGWAQLLRGANLGEAKVATALKAIEMSARMQAKLVEDMLDISRIRSQKLSLKTEPIDLLSVVDAGIEFVKISAEAKNIQLASQLNSAMVMGDSDRLQQVLCNLLSNAIKFTPPGGRVEVTTESVQNDVEIRVRDTGKGIRADFLPFVFDRFRQADSSSSKTSAGLGLGLEIARHIVELHGGTIQVESPGEGQGTTATVKLPRILIPSSGKEPVEQLTGEPVSREGLSILVVDDDEDSRDLMKFILERSGAEVLVVASARDAIQALTENPSKYDVLLSDIGMPGEDGYSLIRQVRELDGESGGKIPAVAITAYTSQQDRQKAIAAGFQEHLAKPISPDKLVSTIVNFVAQCR